MKIDNRDIFEQIGNVFYAIAAEQHVKPLEVGELKSLISKDWLPRNRKGNESIVSDETHWIIMAMDTLEGNGASAKEAFREFSSFYQIHPELFTEEIKQRIQDTAVKITKIFKADNPFDNGQLVALKDLLGSNKVEKA
jgi:hypothetical protein